MSRKSLLLLGAFVFLCSVTVLHSLVRAFSWQTTGVGTEVQLAESSTSTSTSTHAVGQKDNVRNRNDKKLKSTKTKTNKKGTSTTHLAKKKSFVPVNQPNVLLAIVSSRDNFSSRARAILDTWAKEVPVGVIPIFFVGEAKKDSRIQSGSPEDVAQLAQTAGIHRSSKVKVVVMKGVFDDEYPPVYKNTDIVKHLNIIAEQLEAKGRTIHWTFKVDDDAYVHFEGMTRFLKTRDWTKDGFYGERGMGRTTDRKGLIKTGLKGFFCMGGSGWIMSRSTLRKTALGMDQCVAAAYQSKYRRSVWHSDTVIGLCVQKSTGNNCWTDKDYDKYPVFRHNYNATLGANFIPSSRLRRMVVLHPYKDAEVMVELHARFQAVETSKGNKK